MKNSIEECWILVGQLEAPKCRWHIKRRRRVIGQAASVEADWAWALAREEKLGDVMGFWHTHPRGYGATPSERDVRTMHAWCNAFDKVLVCVIADGKHLAAYLFDGAEADAREAVIARAPTRGTFVVRPAEGKV